MKRAQACIVAVALCAAGCARGAREDYGRAARFELAGCAAVLRGPVCEVSASERRVRVRVVPDDATVRLAWNEAPIAGLVTKVEGGALITVEVPEPGTGALRIEAERAGARSSFTVPVREGEADPRLDRARALRREGKLAEARAALPADVAPALRGRARSLEARLDLDAGKGDAAIAGLRAGMARHRRDGRASDEVLDGMALIHTLLAAGRYAEARAVLADLDGALQAWDEGRAQIGYYRALIADDTGDLRGALRDLAEAERGARALGIGAVERSVRRATASILERLGRHDEARALFRRELDAEPEAPSCRRAELLVHLGWAELTALDGVPAEAARAFEEARRAFERACPRRADLQNAEVNLALAAAADDDLDRAERHAQAARALGAPPLWIALWMEDLEARLLLARGRAEDALARWEVFARRARDAAAPEASWRALLGRARALDALARRSEAIAALREAERLLDRRAPIVPLDAGRAGWFGRHTESAVLLSELLVQEGKVAEAMRVVRAARTRAVLAVERLARVASLPPEARARWEEALAAYRRERDALDAGAAEAWEIPADKLADAEAARHAAEARARAALDDAFAILGAAGGAEGAPIGEGEILVVYQAFGGPARVFVESARGVTTSALTIPERGASKEALARALLDPIASSIARAARVRVLATGPILGVDLHALPFGEAPLVAHAPVVYGLDLPPVTRPAPAALRALVVIDPRGDLRGARAESERVEAQLRSGFAVTTLAGERAGRAEVTAALGQATLFHFAGHGLFGGATGWESALALAGTGALALGDILALPAAPRFVVLSGCETGRSADLGGMVDLSLAHAFLSAGTESVVATVRPVRDDLAAAMAAALYAHVGRPSWDPAAALREAQLERLREATDVDWAAYRAVAR